MAKAFNESSFSEDFSGKAKDVAKVVERPGR